MRHFIRDDQVGGHDVQVVLGALRDAGIDILTHMDVIHRAVRIGLYKPVFRRGILHLREKLRKSSVVGILILHGIPHLEKSQGQRPDRLALKPDSGVFPMTIRMRHIKIFIRHVIAARKSHASVNHRDLAVIAVVEKQIDKG